MSTVLNVKSSNESQKAIRGKNYPIGQIGVKLCQSASSNLNQMHRTHISDNTSP